MRIVTINIVINNANHNTPFNIENNGQVSILTNGIKFNILNANPNITAKHINITIAITGDHFINI
jgi:hypothetical protein